MFTGIVEEVGRLVSRPEGGLEIAAETVLEDLRLGDSICVNGACLTVTRLEDGRFFVDTVPETLRRTNLGELGPGDPVNLERALAASARLGGHIVQGHVETTAEVAAVSEEGEALLVSFRVPAEFMPYIVAKGFVTVDGISLTVVSRDAESFMVTLIPYTQAATGLARKPPGARVNIETDVLARYVESLLTRTQD
jgi:riboflavin synthase